MEFFEKLLASSDFMPHGHCYLWKPEIVWLHVISDGVIAFSYYSIPLILIYFILRRKDFPFPWLLGMFGAFILLCGTTHIMAIVTLWNPIYRLDGVIKALTAGISVLTTIVLIPLVPQALALRSPKELEAANASLNSANEKLREIDQLKDNFFSNVSHELRTPLTLILAPLESLLAQEYGSFSDSQRKQLEVMHNNSIRLFQMVNSILDFAKISAGKIEIKRESVDLVSLTQSIVEEFQFIAQQKKITIHYFPSLPKNVVNIDRYIFERILFNLLSNAVKFTPEQGSITVSLQFDEGKTLLSVKDTGIGISDLGKRTLFQKFRQVDGSATRRFEGTGLGLALVKEFSTLLGGDVNVESELGKGSTFTVRIETPLAEISGDQDVERKSLSGRFQKYQGLLHEEGQEDREIPPAGGGNKTTKILIAEDNVELASYLKSTLASADTSIRHVTNGDEALSMARTWLPDLILSDVMMPQRDGFALCKAIKSDRTTSAIPVILLTALTHRDALIKGWESGADEYLIKPFHPTELRTRIRSILALVNERSLRKKESERLAELEQFPYFASHDLREPMRVMITMSELLQVQYSEIIPKDANQMLGSIRDASLRMKNIIDDLIVFSTLEGETPNFSLTSSEKAVQESLANLAISIKEMDAKVSFQDLPLILGDQTQLIRLFQNLIGNAIKYHSDAKPEIQISAKKMGADWLFSVKDNGIGFDPKYAERIFVIFKRLHSSQQYPGTGAGLAICKKIVTRHQGRIWAESEPGKGSTFYFTLPTPENLTTGH